MSVPIIICDDSSFARKQVARALPKGWNVDITYATNGQEGVEAIAAGKGDVLFLDLTMPVMDGFEVLEYIRAHDLPTLPIVISGDIQPDSYTRVMELGAVAFVKKPVDAEALCKTLDDYGVLDILTATEPTSATVEMDTSVDFYDWCQEISNVSMGRAAELLAKVIDDTVLISIPKVNELESSELDMMLQATISGGVYAVNQGFIGRGIAGETMIIFDQQDINQIAQLMGHTSDDDQESSFELLMDVSNILVGAFLKGIANQLDIDLSQGLPEIYDHENNHTRTSNNETATKKTLAIELSYTLGKEKINCDQLVLFTEASQKKLNQIISYAMGDI